MAGVERHCLIDRLVESTIGPPREAWCTVAVTLTVRPLETATVYQTTNQDQKKYLAQNLRVLRRKESVQSQLNNI